MVLAFAPWRAVLAVECSRAKYDGHGYVLCRVRLPHDDLRVLFADESGKRFEGFEPLRETLERQGRHLAFAMNAGMFHPDFRPVGLLVIDGRELAPINRDPGTGNFFLQPNGVFLVDDHGARVLATDEYRGLTPRFATQSGPMLLRGGAIPGNSAFRANSTSRHIRNGVCAPTPRLVAFAISEDEVTFYEFARYFQRALGCHDALYLDGTVSSLYAPALRRDDHHAALGPLIAVIE